MRPTMPSHLEEKTFCRLTTKVQRLALCDTANFSVDPIPSRYGASIPSFYNNIYLFIIHLFIKQNSVDNILNLEDRSKLSIQYQHSS